MRSLPDMGSYDAPSTHEIAQRAGIEPSRLVRFDGNTSPRVPVYARPDALIEELDRINTYPHGGYLELLPAIARYAGVKPDNIVLGAGADDVIMLVIRSFAGPGDRVAIANDPTYPLFRIAVALAGADVGDDDPVLTVCCRPNNPTGDLGALPSARPLLVDEAYYEYSGVTALDLIDEGVILVRTFSKAFGLAGARVGYAVAHEDVAADLNRRQGPAPVSTLSAALAMEALAAGPPNVAPLIAERERFSLELRSLGLEPLEAHANFVAVPTDRARELAAALTLKGLPVRPYAGGIRITIRNRNDDDLLLHALGGLLGHDST